MIARVLVVGAAGQLGGGIARRLVGRDHVVRALVRDRGDAARLKELGAEAVVGDLRDVGSLEAACQDVSHVVTTANAFLGRFRNSSAQIDRRGNVNLIDASARAGVSRFVFLSGCIMRADSLVDFFRHKQAAEVHLERSGLDYVIVRAGAFMDVWGEIVAGGIATTGVATIFGDGRNPINFIARDDVADFVVRILDDPAVSRESIAVGGPQNLSLLDVVETYEKHIGRSARRKHIPVPAMRILRNLLGLDPLTRRKMSAGIEMATVTQTMDIAPLLKRFPGLQLQSIDEWLSRKR
ncbi:MAG: SDR family oxidoreductase [Gemmatimonadota bacterium]